MTFWVRGHAKWFVVAFVCCVVHGVGWGMSPGVPEYQSLSLQTVFQGAAETGVAPPSGKQWYRFANHTHTTYSPDAYATLEERLQGAAAEGADVVVITDHNRNDACSDPLFVTTDGCVPMCGEEYAWGHFDGELNLLNISSSAHIGGDTVEAVVESAHSAGGTVVVNHPFIGSEPWSYEDLHLGISGIEVWTTLFFAFSGGEDALNWWDGFLKRGRMVFAIGGSDIHVSTASVLRPCNYVLADAQTPDAIQDGLEAGNITISETSTGPRCFIWCDANNDDIFENPMGSNVIANGDVSLRFRVEVYDGEGLTLNVFTKQGIVNSYTVGTGAPWCVEFTASGAGVKDYVRAELRTTNEAYPIAACSNPVYVNFTPGDSDGDGIPDVQEQSYGTDKYSADTDGDGLSDGFEIGYDGNANAYDPYEPVNHPEGGDLNALSADTDGDGVDDATERWLGSNPLDASDAALLPVKTDRYLVMLLGCIGLVVLRRRQQRYDGAGRGNTF